MIVQPNYETISDTITIEFSLCFVLIKLMDYNNNGLTTIINGTNMIPRPL